MLLRAANVRVLDTAGRSSGARFDAYRIDDTFHIDIDLPGVNPAGIDISSDDEGLTVRAQRAEGQTGPDSRQVLLADALDCDRVDCRYDNGVLTLKIPVRESVSAGTAASSD
ncbi:Hsp20/alpha crystallin family protein [Paractinoplanes toevensis]|uniref:SHSP domain-containing protein n=1 Tax=Paractinoplanes toevensis TaxID=571911 RepID=A0A919TAH2_9ACTN|nr:Hsp20/alpha crystallin family protein [Actinoplanes toevensis]GIM91687.1 hypothetical protein Ato02nite_034800 [Actinoplanes toevensis]